MIFSVYDDDDSCRTKRHSPIKPLHILVLLPVILYILFTLSRAPFPPAQQKSTSGSHTTFSSASLYEPYATLFSYIVKPGDTFAGILSRCNISEPCASFYYTALRSIGFSTLFPGDSLVVTKGNNDKVKKFSLLSKLDCWYHIYDYDSTLQAEKTGIELDVYRCMVKGTLTTSLSEDMFRFKVGDAIVIKLVDIFAWDINFFLDPRQGDTFEVIFEKLYREGRFIGYGSILAAKYINTGKVFCAIGMKDSAGVMQYYDENGKSVQKEFLKAPLRFNRITSGFSYSRKHPVLGIYRPHLAIDYAAPHGTPVYAAADGIVTFSGWDGGYGNHIRISHGASYITFYGHLDRINSGISTGRRVSQGQCIGVVGATGIATGPHLDYRMKCGSRFINPRSLSLPSKKGLCGQERIRFETVKQSLLALMDQRMNAEGCIVLDILPSSPQPSVVTNLLSNPVFGNDQ